jgi:hypothetical protein
MDKAKIETDLKSTLEQAKANTWTNIKSGGKNLLVAVATLLLEALIIWPLAGIVAPSHPIGYFGSLSLLIIVRILLRTVGSNSK